MLLCQEAKPALGNIVGGIEDFDQEDLYTKYKARIKFPYC